MRCSNALAAALAALCSCRQAPSGVSPAVTSVDPAQHAVGSAVPVAIVGTGFYLRAVEPLGAGPTELDDQFQAWLVAADGSRTALLPVSWQQEDRLSAVVPAGLPAGLYGLAVEGPFGGASLSPAYTATERPSALLTAAASAPSPLYVGQAFEAALQVQDVGDGAAAAVGPSGDPEVSPNGALDLLSSPAPQDVAAQSTLTFRYSFVPRAAGSMSLGLSVAGQDALSGAAVGASAQTQIQVASAATLSSAATLDAPTAAVGDEATAVLTLANDGDLAATGLSASVTPSDPALVTLVSAGAPATFDLAAGAVVAYPYRYQAKAVGSLTFSFQVTGQEQGSGKAVSTLAQTGSLTLTSAPAPLSAELDAPNSAHPGGSFQVTLTATNALGAGTLRVAPAGDPVMAGGGGAHLQQRPDTTAVPLGVGAAKQWTWVYRAQGPGPVTFTATAVATDSSGATWSAAASCTIAVQTSP